MRRKPTVVCFCGSTRFLSEFQSALWRETLEGKIVLSIVEPPTCLLDATRMRAALRGQLGGGGTDEGDQLKARLHELHLRKIDLADEVLILNVGGYIGESTARELAYARTKGKHVRYLERPDQEKGWNDGR